MWSIVLVAAKPRANYRQRPLSATALSKQAGAQCQGATSSNASTQAWLGAECPDQNQGLA